LVQDAFKLYWSFSHLVTFVLLALLILQYRLAPRIQFGGAWIAGVVSRNWRRFDVAVIALAIAHCAFYLWVPNFADYGEPVIPILAGNYLHGAPVYSDWHLGNAVVGSNYGPYVFLSQAPVLLLHPTIAASKFIGVFFAVTSIILMLFCVRNRLRSTTDALTLCALMVGLLAFELHYWFWNRPDSILLATVALGALLFDRARPAICLAGLGLLAGVAMNLKLFGVIYLVPLAFACLFMMRSRSEFIAGGLFGGALFVVAVALPFETGGFSLQAYIANLSMMPNQGFIASAVMESMFYGLAILLLPLLTWRMHGAGREEQVIAIALVACTILVAVLAGKPGGGAPYMMPLIPSALYLAARLSQRTDGSATKPLPGIHRFVVLAVVLCAAPIWSYSWFQMAKQIPAASTEAAKSSELRSLFATFPSAEMGHNSGISAENDEFFRVERTFLGQVTRFDYVNFADQRAAGLPGSVLYPLLDRCRVPTWILARQGGRFLGSGYGVSLLDDGALDRFRANYELAGQYRFYEVWRCREHADDTASAQPSPMR
jgi:hypothetical protein